MSLTIGNACMMLDGVCDMQIRFDSGSLWDFCNNNLKKIFESSK